MELNARKIIIVVIIVCVRARGDSNVQKNLCDAS